jgi:Na+(H+)/acetate symporter ActP
VLAGKILALATSIAAGIANRKQLMDHAPADEHLFGAPVEELPITPGFFSVAAVVTVLPIVSVVDTSGSAYRDEPQTTMRSAHQCWR